MEKFVEQEVALTPFGTDGAPVNGAHPVEVETEVYEDDSHLSDAEVFANELRGVSVRIGSRYINPSADIADRPNTKYPYPC